MDAIFGLDQINSVAAAIWKEGKKHPVWAFYAPMGSGKTTFIHALCELLGVESNISSPTYSIINEYQTKDLKAIYHIDLYRLKGEQEALNAGVEEPLMSGNTCFVEWPENAARLLPDNTFHVSLEVLDEFTRRIYVMNHNPNLVQV